MQNGIEIKKNGFIFFPGVSAISWFAGGAIRRHVGHTIATGGIIQYRLGTIAGSSGRFIRSISIGSKPIAVYAVRAVRSVSPELVQPAKRIPAATATAAASRTECPYTGNVSKQFIPIPHRT